VLLVARIAALRQAQDPAATDERLPLAAAAADPPPLVGSLAAAAETRNGRVARAAASSLACSIVAACGWY